MPSDTLTTSAPGTPDVTLVSLIRAMEDLRRNRPARFVLSTYLRPDECYRIPGGDSLLTGAPEPDLIVYGPMIGPMPPEVPDAE